MMLPMKNLQNIFIFFLAILLPMTLASNVQAANFNFGGVRMKKDVKTMKELRQENVVTQSLDFSCGAAGLATLLNYYLNDPITETEIISDLLQIVPLEKVKERMGFSLYDLKKYSELKGYVVTGYKMDFDFLRDVGRPLLVPIKFKNYRHFVVVKAVIGDRVFIADPALGNVSVKDEKFKQMWTNGIGFVVEHSGDKTEEAQYALKVETEDIRFADYKKMRQLADITRLRTTIFPNEW